MRRRYTRTELGHTLETILCGRVSSRPCFLACLIRAIFG